MKKTQFLILALLLSGVAVGANPDRWDKDTRAIYGRFPDAPRQMGAVTWSDWFVFRESQFGFSGVARIVNEAAAGGIDTLMWRSHGGGVALYPTAIAAATVRNHSSNTARYGEFHGPKVAAELCRKLDKKLLIWVTPLEEAHAHACNSRSRYAELHPELLERRRSGEVFDAPSFFFPQYRKYKTDIIAELADEVRPDGFLFDLERQGTPARNWETGYLPEALREYRRRYRLAETATPAADDPRWTAFRADWVATYLREARRLIKERNPQAEMVGFLTPMTKTTVNRDPVSWCREKLFDSIVLVKHSTKRWGHAATFEARDRQIYPTPTMYGTVYLYDNNRRLNRQSAESAVAAGMAGMVYMETVNLAGGAGRYSLPRSLAFPDQVTLESSIYDLGKGGRLRVLATGAWTLEVDGRVLSSGTRGEHREVEVPATEKKLPLRFEVKLAADTDAAGLVVEGELGGRKIFSRPGDWKSSNAAGTLETVATGLPGIPPFLNGLK